MRRRRRVRYHSLTSTIIDHVLIAPPTPCRRTQSSAPLKIHALLLPIADTERQGCLRVSVYNLEHFLLCLRPSMKAPEMAT